MRLYRDRAVVLRQHKLGEADRIVTLLTRENGVVRAVAKGVRRTRSKFGARLEPFAHIDVQLHPGRNLDIVTQVQSIDAFAVDIVSDYGRYTCACAMLCRICSSASRIASTLEGMVGWVGSVMRRSSKQKRLRGRCDRQQLGQQLTLRRQPAVHAGAPRRGLR